MKRADDTEVMAQFPQHNTRIDTGHQIDYDRHGDLTQKTGLGSHVTDQVREELHPLEVMDNLRTLSMWSTLECALVNLPMGSTGVNLKPFSLTQFEKDNGFSGWVNRAKNNPGRLPSIYEPNLLANASNMQLVMDEFESMHGYRFPAALHLQQDNAKETLSRSEASAYSIVVTLGEALRELGIPINKSTAVVQGCGDIARYATKWFTKMGGRVIGITCPDELGHSYSYYRKSEGINIDKLLSEADQLGQIDRHKAISMYYEVLPGNSWIEEHVDVLLLCGTDDKINGLNADRISPEVKIVVEGAPGAIAQEADLLLNQQGIMVIPGFLANAGGAVCSFYELVRHSMSKNLNKKEILAKIDEKLSHAFHEIYNLSLMKNKSMRETAYSVARNRNTQTPLKAAWR